MEISLRHRHTLIVGDCAFSHKIDHAIFMEILNLEGHLNHITSSEVTATLTIGGASAVECLLSTRPTRVVLFILCLQCSLGYCEIKSGISA